MATKKEKEKETWYEDPPDGGWGWMVVLHCFLVRWQISCKIPLHDVTVCGYYKKLCFCVCASR